MFENSTLFSFLSLSSPLTRDWASLFLKTKDKTPHVRTRLFQLNIHQSSSWKINNFSREFQFSLLFFTCLHVFTFCISKYNIENIPSHPREFLLTVNKPHTICKTPLAFFHPACFIFYFFKTKYVIHLIIIPVVKIVLNW